MTLPGDRVRVKFRTRPNGRWEEMVVDFLDTGDSVVWFSGRPDFGTVTLRDRDYEFTWEDVDPSTPIKRPHNAVWQ